MRKRSRGLYHQLEVGLREGIEFLQGRRKLPTTVLPSHRVKRLPLDVARLRKRSGLSQAEFARMLNVPLATVRNWESGRRKPSQAALRLLQVLDAEPEAVRRVAGTAV